MDQVIHRDRFHLNNIPALQGNYYTARPSAQPTTDGHEGPYGSHTPNKEFTSLQGFPKKYARLFRNVPDLLSDNKEG